MSGVKFQDSFLFLLGYLMRTIYNGIPTASSGNHSTVGVGYGTDDIAILHGLYICIRGLE